jgi:electron transfer flavoprotein alpha subunit
MNASKKVIAINQDPQAPIFKIADLGIVADAREILPRLIKDLEAISRPVRALDLFP